MWGQPSSPILPSNTYIPHIVISYELEFQTLHRILFQNIWLRKSWLKVWLNNNKCELLEYVTWWAKLHNQPLCADKRYSNGVWCSVWLHWSVWTVPGSPFSHVGMACSLYWIPEYGHGKVMSMNVMAYVHIMKITI